MTSADVYAAGSLAGHVTREPDATTFTYAEGYDGPALVPHLPVGTTTWPAGALPPLLSNLLPEGRRLEALRQQVKTSLDNEVALLLAIGNDLVGDLQFVPAGTRPTGSSATQIDLGRLDTLEFARLRGLPVSGVPGVQDKVKISERMSLPVRDASLSTHLLKFGQQGVAQLIANERACLQALADARLEVSQADVVVDATGETALLVTRFDRRVAHGTVTALRQLDGCQAAGRYPADKEDLDTLDVVTALAGLCANRCMLRERLSRCSLVMLPPVAGRRSQSDQADACAGLTFHSLLPDPPGRGRACGWLHVHVLGRRSTPGRTCTRQGVQGSLLR